MIRIRKKAILFAIIFVLLILLFLGWNAFAGSKVDMTGEYYPYIDFKIVQPEIKPSVENLQNLFMLVLVNSGAVGKYRHRRGIIRKTWGSQESCEQYKVLEDPNFRSLQWQLVFVVGKSGDKNDEFNKQEATVKQDMVIGDIQENYLNNIIKLYMGILWASTTMPKVKYILKADDDVYIRVPQVLRYLAKEQFPNHLYGGATYTSLKWRGVMRNPDNKWGLSWKYYSERVWPPFNPGAFVLISHELLHGLLEYVKIQKPFHLDDAYMGIAMRAMNIVPVKISSFVIVRANINVDSVLHGHPDCFLLALTAIGHRIEPESIAYFHNRMQHLCFHNAGANKTTPCHKHLQFTEIFNL